VNRSSALADKPLLDLANRLAGGAGLGRARALSRLAGGNNNQIYRVDLDAGAPVALKRYFSDPRDGRDRLATEWEFLDRAWQEGVRSIPQALSRDKPAQAALYSFVPGRKLSAAELGARHIEAAADFIVAINAKPHASLPPASDACFSLADHLEIVSRRLLRLAALDPQTPHVREAERFVAAGLRPAWEAVQAHLVREVRALGFDLHQRLTNAECCLSPSDFGFHNALATDAGTLVFLDFEYAGCDDPAKLVVDFFCQPQVPVSYEYCERFIARLTDGLRLDAAASARCRLLRDICRIKWVCIMLNDFLPVGAARRAFADGSERDLRCATQLDKAKAKLDEIGLEP
jgi:Ser/Thr protein kinase RdoA (MazF antagonist)